MAQRKYSTQLVHFTQEITNTDLLASLSDLKIFLGKKVLKRLIWDDNYIAIPINISVELPPLGNFENIDIRSIEPVLVVISLIGYPRVPPTVYPDRLDFPKDRLAHLYVAKHDKPPAICLIRGSITEWYANKRLKDLIIRLQNWFRDAVTGQLTIDGDRFDPVRLEGYSGTVIYDYDQFATVITTKQSYFPESDFTIGLFERSITEKGPSFKLNKIITTDSLQTTYEDFLKEKEKDNNLASKKHYHFGYVVWSNEEIVFSQYAVDWPSDWVNFKNFCTNFGIDLSNLELCIASYDLNTYVLIPVIIGIRRPKPLIGFSGNIEFFNFYLRVDSSDKKDGAIVNNIPVSFQAHKQPLNLKKAREIAGVKGDFGSFSLIVGCGALGSKIIMHLARSGVTNYLMVDPDELSPHNLVRHATFANSEGLNKAEALKKEITRMYPYEKLALMASGEPGEIVLASPLLKVFSWIFDFTASNSFFHSLIKAPILGTCKVCKAFLSDFGNLGILFLEGNNRNPRIDDLQIILYDQYRHLPSVSAWLQRESKQQENNLSVTVGIGCNSETIVLSDDVVSFQSAYFTGVIKSEVNKDDNNSGKIYLNEINDVPFFSNTSRLINIPPLDVLHATNDATWQVRFQSDIIERMKAKMQSAMPYETGGILVGRANYKTKTIHVVEVLNAPLDSQSNEVCFFRGIEGLPETIQEINELSGNQLGYIGEWHTHPMGPNQLSITDLRAVKKFKTYFEKQPTPLPVFLVIITPTHILPYVF